MTEVTPLPNATFASLNLSPEVLAAIERFGWKHPTPIQLKVIPLALEGKDILGCAQTGTGKTGAFVLPMVERLANSQQQLTGLVLCPTREIALQSQEDFDHFGPPKRVSATTIIGGASMHNQFQALKRRPTVLVATPGRLLDHLERGTVHLNTIRMLVLDEADRMLDMGFMPQITRILARMEKEKQKHQTLLFSATLPVEIERLIRHHLHQPVRVEVERSGKAAAGVEQALYMVESASRREALLKLLDLVPGTTLIFTRTKRQADTVAQFLKKADTTAAPIHSDLSQRERVRALDGFKSGRYRVLVATDIVARGIDVEDIAHVINFHIPNSPDDYVHRIGRTARAAKKGHASTIVCPEEIVELKAIERKLGSPIPRKQLPGMTVAEHTPPAGRSQMGRRHLKRRW